MQTGKSRAGICDFLAYVKNSLGLITAMKKTGLVTIRGFYGQISSLIASDHRPF